MGQARYRVPRTSALVQYTSSQSWSHSRHVSPDSARLVRLARSRKGGNGVCTTTGGIGGCVQVILAPCPIAAERGGQREAIGGANVAYGWVQPAA